MSSSMTSPAPWPRTILHVDMDAFYASVEQLDDPRLRGKPVLVGGNGRRGVVGAASYEARKFGCRSAMPMAQARALCPHAMIVPPRFARYRELSDRLMDIMESYSPLVEPLSLDEAFVDVTGCERLHGDGVTIAQAIRARVRQELGLTCSVGVAPNKFVAKLGSDLQKPDGMTVLPAEGMAERLAPLAIERMWGVGPVAAEAFHRIGVRTFGDLQRLEEEHLANLMGDGARDWKRLSFGEDTRPVVVDRTAKSVGHEQTFGEDLRDRNEVEAYLLQECDDVAARLRRKGMKASRVTVKISIRSREPQRHRGHRGRTENATEEGYCGPGRRVRGRRRASASSQLSLEADSTRRVGRLKANQRSRILCATSVLSVPLWFSGLISAKAESTAA
jgi:DNA polymerase-4